MSASDPVAPPAAAAAAASQDAGDGDGCAELRVLADIGAMSLELARAAQRLAMLAVAHETALYEAAAAATVPGEAPPPIKERPASPSLVMSYARIARTARDCAEAAAKAAPKPAKAGEPRRASGAARRRLNAMKDEVRRHVEHSIKASVEPRHVERMMLDLDERLDDPEVEAEFGVLTAGQLVLSVCRDLQVTPDLSKWPEEMLQTAISAHFGTPMPPKPAGSHGMTVGMAADKTIEKLPTGVIGSPGVPPAMAMPPWPHPAPKPPPPQDGPRDPAPGHDPPPAPRRPPDSFFAR